jgi:hypothetical protein
MLEVSLFHHGGFVDVESDGDAVVVGELGELFYVLDVGAADVGIEKHGVAVAVLATHQIVEILFHVLEGFGKAGFFVDGLDREINGGDAGVGETVGDGGAQQSSIGGEINPEIFFGRVLDDFVDEVWTQERFAAGRGEDAAGRGVQPIDGASGGVFAHAADAIIVGPAVVAIEIAFPLREEVGDDGPKFSGEHSGFKIGSHPAAHGFEDAIGGPVTLAGADDRVVGGDVLRVEFVY